MKTCTKCGIEKSESEFSKHSGHKSGLSSQCKECSNKYKKEYYNNNKDKTNEHRKERRRADINYNIKCRLRCRVNSALKGYCKSKKTMQLLGCTIEEFKTHLSSQFYNHPITDEPMSFSNYGSWHLDHIIPCAAFVLENSEEQ